MNPSSGFFDADRKNAAFEEWCEFFRENNFPIGLIIDGPRHLHDTYRYDKGGAGTFDKVVRAACLLQRHKVEFNVLYTVNAANSRHLPDRVLLTPDGEPGLNWLCAGLKAFYPHTQEPMRTLAELLKRGRFANEIIPMLAKETAAPFAHTGRNDPCPCGSGRRFKRCHGGPRAEESTRHAV